MPSFEFEIPLWGRGIRLIAGVDEAGRGPLAGPVVAAAVILYPGDSIEGVNDSKMLTESRRETLFSEITSRAVSIGTGIISEKEIDAINILQASLKAMSIAVSNLTVSPEYALIDGNKTPVLRCPGIPIIHGDSRSLSIAAASIIAKVTRDRLMRDLDSRYPQYGFAQHKGYGTRAHRQAIRDFGLCAIHRKSFQVTFPS